MKYAIISDVHSNLEAFQAVLEDLSKEKVDQVFFLGDIVGYCADPNPCIEILQGLTTIVIAGNHDWATVGLTKTSYFNPLAKVAIEWTARKITQSHKEFLKTLPLIQTRNTITLVHAAPNQPEKWDYIFSLQEASLSFNYYDHQICFIGHSHRPIAFVEDEERRISILINTSFTLRDSHRYIINVGSVGQSRDGNPRAAYGIYNTDDVRFTLRRIPYNIERTQKKIMDAGLPPFLASRLASGR
ncbi:MAG: metallophosphoesterase family protein [Deltaproteobacteria bacterium]|jgi:diadenosine tetraphosphatase ApaH/serine/threonine PP2A family protein phosphatase|nr:metallophosphoesterase family protein [Deltaproteobacteria bacterium]MCK5186501.1 metallophosphoesterase family protein [Deltaproteobacteria bacterium]MCK5257019.1 metallophosphoesterase family protein [Deltaproteobacteria bacterium]MCK5421654.1 metallophosphoesterase family protein [Deltaproteobacteria bacterium]MCK5514329.1 metallophosphoesterase family protein [Deltaproteobacteria bacterium]